jgi:hypothetical protein
MEPDILDAVLEKAISESAAAQKLYDDELAKLLPLKKAAEEKQEALNALVRGILKHQMKTFVFNGLAEQRRAKRR